MRKKNTTTYFIIIIILCVATVTVFLSGADPHEFDTYTEMASAFDEKLIEFDTDWSITSIDRTYSHVELPFMLNVPKGEDVIASNRLPPSLTDGTLLAFRNLPCFVKIRVGEETIYSSPVIVNGDRESPLPCWVFVPLETEYAGRQITVIMNSPYPNYSGMVPAMTLGTNAEVLLYASSSGYFDLYLSITVIVLGILIMIFAVTDPSDTTSLRRYLPLGIFIALLGATVISRSGIPRISMSRGFLEYMLQETTLRLCPVFYALYMEGTAEGTGKKVYDWFFILSSLSLVVSFAAHFRGLCDFTASSRFIRILLSAELLASLYIRRGKAPGTRARRALRNVGVIVLAAGITLGIIPRTEIYVQGLHLRNMACLIFALTHCLNMVLESYREATGRVILAKELSESRIKLMMSQMQPHFIYNTLSTIRSMIKKAPDRAYDLIQEFAGYLRYNINAMADVPIIPFNEELNHIRVYTSIEKERFGDRLNVEYDTGHVAFFVPPLSVQPFVENAVKHGVCMKPEGGTVTLTTSPGKDCDIITIRDDGTGFDTSLLEDPSRRGIGINNAVYRLENQVGADVDIKSRPGEGTTVTITVPRGRRITDEDHSGGR
ncbi:MAG: histidine kinase [Eubacteriaceae bacterium]|nr:histidine kinase [Eubacteriaceae bacterium]